MAYLGSTEASFERPPWRSPAAYMPLRTASLAQIAWEFLRRNPDYQRAWESFRKRADELGSRGPGDVLAEFGDDAPNVVHEFSVNQAREWGLNEMLDPSVGSPGPFTFSGGGSSYALVDGTAIPRTPQNPVGTQRLSKWMVVKVDLSFPLNVIEAQLLAAVHAQRRARIRRGVVHPVECRALRASRYVEYLRILDAHAMGADIKEIGDVLAPHAANDEDRQRDKRFRAALAEATRLQREGYRVLPLLQPATVIKKK